MSGDAPVRRVYYTLDMGQSRQAFMALAGAVRGPKDLSSRKGFARYKREAIPLVCPPVA